jgi:hypothetical protein
MWVVRFSLRVLLFSLLLALAPAASLLMRATPAHAADFPYADGDLLQVTGDDKIHLIRGDQRHWIADTLSLQQLNPEFSRLKRVSFEQLSAIPAGKPLHAGPLIRDPVSGRVYLLTKETDWPAPRKHWINSLDSFSALGFDWSDVAVNWSVPVDQYAFAPALTFAPVGQGPATVNGPNGALSAVPAWRLQAQDDQLFLGLAAAYTYNQDWQRQVAGKLVSAGTWIEWGDLPPDADGRYDVATNKITVSQSLKGESLGVLAATLTHEVLHAVTIHGPDVAACFAEEASAFAYEAGTWAALPAPLRSQTIHAQFLDTLTMAYRLAGPNALLKTVSSDPAYQQECAGNAGRRGTLRLISFQGATFGLSLPAR